MRNGASIRAVTTPGSYVDLTLRFSTSPSMACDHEALATDGHVPGEPSLVLMAKNARTGASRSSCGPLTAWYPTPKSDIVSRTPSGSAYGASTAPSTGSAGAVADASLDVCGASWTASSSFARV
jgi:hypothetical protein